MILNRSGLRKSKHKLYVGFYVACRTRRVLGTDFLTGLIQNKSEINVDCI